MALRNGRVRRDHRLFRQRVGSVGPALAIALAGLVAACSPTIEAYRSLSGADKNDPDPKTAPFTGNMAAAYKQPYPNLASVPPPPTRETSTADRQKLTQALIADRTATAALAGPPPIAAATANAAQPAATAIPPSAGAPARTAPASPAAVGAAAPPAQAELASNTLQPAANRAPARRPGEPPEPGPLNSTLQMPQMPSLPEPEAVRPPPPAPTLAALPLPPAAGPPPAMVASAMPQPPPPPPVLPPISPPPIAVKPPPKPAPAPTTVATLGLAGRSAAADSSDRAQIARVAALYKQKPGTVRVVAFTAAPAAGGDPLASYHAALERAQAIAQALAAAGVPAGKIQTEATPAAGPQIGRVEIQFAP